MSSTKDFILEAVRNNKPKEDLEYPVIPVYAKSKEDILEEFKENLVIGAGAWYEITAEQDATELVKKLHPDAKVICSAVSEIKGNKDLSKIEDPHDLNDVDVGIIRAQFGVSENGMVWMTEKDLKINSLGFLSQHLIVLLKPDRLVRDMYEAYAEIQLDKDNYGCFMLGPSATADIGAFMVHGAQGARSLTVFFM